MVGCLLRWRLLIWFLGIIELEYIEERLKKKITVISVVLYVQANPELIFHLSFWELISINEKSMVDILL